MAHRVCLCVVDPGELGLWVFHEVIISLNRLRVPCFFNSPSLSGLDQVEGSI